MADTEQTTKSTVGTHETGAVEHERVAQPEINLGREREYETGKDESWFANIKRTYDEYLHESLDAIRKNSTYIQRVLSSAAEYDSARQNIANQALQNAVETANMVAKQTVRHTDNTIETANLTGKQTTRHADVAIDRQWNVDEQGYTVADILRDSTFKDAIAAAVAVAVNQVNASK